MQLTFKDRDNELVFDGSAEELQLAMYEIRELRSVRSFVRSEGSTAIEPRSLDVRSALFAPPLPASEPVRIAPSQQSEIIEATAQTVLPLPALPPAKRRRPKWLIPVGFAIVFGGCVGFAVLFAIDQAQQAPTPPTQPAKSNPQQSKPKPNPSSNLLRVPSPPNTRSNQKLPPPPPNVKVCVPLPATKPPKCN